MPDKNYDEMIHGRRERWPDALDPNIYPSLNNMYGEDTSLTSGRPRLIEDRMALRDTAPIKSVQGAWMKKVDREGYIPQHHILVNMSKGWSKLLRHGPQDTRHPIYR